VEARERPDALGRPIAVFNPTRRQRPLLEPPDSGGWVSGDGSWGAAATQGQRIFSASHRRSPITHHPSPISDTGIALREAEVRWPDVSYRQDDPAGYARAIEPVLDVLASYSPTVEWHAEPANAPVAVRHDPLMRYAVFLDATGLAALYDSEERLGRLIVQAVREQAGHQAQVGIADGRYAALRCAVLSAGEQTTDDLADAPKLVPTGGDAVFLAPLSVDLLPLPPGARAQVARLGVRTLGEFSCLPLNSVRLRLGLDGVIARSLAAGLDEGPLRPRPTPLLLHDTIELEWTETSLDRLHFLLKRLADRLSVRLAHHGLGCGRLHVRWLLDVAGLTSGDDLENAPLTPQPPLPHAGEGGPREQDGAIVSTIRLAEPAGSGALLLEHLRWHTEGLSPETFRDPATGLFRGVRGIVVEAEELAPLGGRQLTLLPGEGGWTAQPERLLAAERALARLQARWGEETVRQAEPVASRRPEQRYRWRASGFMLNGARVEGKRTRRQASAQRRSTPTGDQSTASFPAGAPPASLWLHGQPQEVEIDRARRLPNGQRRRGAIVQGRRKRRVISATVPRRLVERWATEPIEQDTYHVVLTDGSAYRLVHEQASDRWRVLGTFD
jgi:hypothetical protein